MKAELDRRHTKTEAILDLLRSRRGQWIDIHELARAGGFSAWRTRVSDARAFLDADEEIIWNKRTIDSAYMLRHKLQGRDPQIPTLPIDQGVLKF
jgi:hypothetical protein